MAPGLKAVPMSDSESDSEEDELIQKKIRLMQKLAELEQESNKFSYGVKASSDEQDNHLTSSSLSSAEKKGLKEVKDLERELDLKNTFSKETNRRDEDAEMNKYIDEQIRLRREAAKKERQRLEAEKSSKREQKELEADSIFTLPAEATDKIDDILLHSLSRNLASTSDERSEAMLSSQMLNGIPEVDLGINESIRTIEATEEAKLKLALGGSSRHPNKKTGAPVNYSSNFQQHRHTRDTRDGQLKTSKVDRPPTSNSAIKTVVEAVVRVGEEPEEIEYRLPTTGERPPPRGKASDDYYLSRYRRSHRK